MAKRSVLAVFAHPDDETGVGPLLARLAREGHDVYLASITSGQKGFRTHAGIPPGEELGRVREEELRCAARQLGIHEPFLLGFEDQGIAPPAVAEQVARRIRLLFEETRPDVVITFGADGITGHIDHRIAGDLATLVFQQQALLAHKPRKLYYVAFPESVLEGSPLARERKLYPVSDRFVTTEIDCRDSLDAARRALECHRSQFAPELLARITNLHSELFRGRVFLRLALSSCPFPAARERSIFEGL
jgi:LmbE family N-acetylglucosaminyl deacetylase